MANPQIIASHAAQPGYVACYFVQRTEGLILVNLPVVLWVQTRSESMTNTPEGRPAVHIVNEFRPFVANRLGQVTDFLNVEMQFLAMCPPYEDWQKVGQAALEHYLSTLAAADERAEVRLDQELAGLDHLAWVGVRTAMLYVEHDNEPAQRLYARLGFAPHRTIELFA